MSEIQRALAGLALVLSPLGVWAVAGYMAVFTENREVWGGIAIGYTVAMVLVISYAVSALRANK